MRPEKTSIANEIKDQLEGSVFVILADYRGLNVVQTADLRKRLRSSNTSFNVVKNRTFSRVARDLSLGLPEDRLTGPTAMVVGEGDVVEAAKILRDFVRETERPTVKMGTLRGAFLSAEDIAHLAGLPGRPELQAMAVGTLAAPMTSLVRALNQKVCSLLYALRAIQEKQEQEQAQ